MLGEVKNLYSKNSLVDRLFKIGATAIYLEQLKPQDMNSLGLDSGDEAYLKLAIQTARKYATQLRQTLTSLRENGINEKDIKSLKALIKTSLEWIKRSAAKLGPERWHKITREIMRNKAVVNKNKPLLMRHGLNIDELETLLSANAPTAAIPMQGSLMAKPAETPLVNNMRAEDVAAKYAMNLLNEKIKALLPAPDRMDIKLIKEAKSKLADSIGGHIARLKYDVPGATGALTNKNGQLTKIVIEGLNNMVENIYSAKFYGYKPSGLTPETPTLTAAAAVNKLSDYLGLYKGIHTASADAMANVLIQKYVRETNPILYAEGNELTHDAKDKADTIMRFANQLYTSATNTLMMLTPNMLRQANATPDEESDVKYYAVKVRNALMRKKSVPTIIDLQSNVKSLHDVLKKIPGFKPPFPDNALYIPDSIKLT